MPTRTGWLLALVPLLIACSPGRADDRPLVAPGSVGLDADALAEILPAMEAIVDRDRLAGGVALVARRGEVAYLRPFGLRDIESGEPMTDDTIFAIASMTKPVTCVAVMSLYEAGKIGLDDPIGDYLPELKDLQVIAPQGAGPGEDGAIPTVPTDRPVTIRDLLSHTSGISYGGFLGSDERIAKAYDEAGVMARDLETVAEQVRRLGEVPLSHQPGERWTYGLSHDVLGRLVEVVSGVPLDQYLDEHIFSPLGMADTGFLVPEADRDRVATIYRSEGGSLVPLPRNYGSATFFAGGAGLFSTARDYARFARMLLDGGTLDDARILERETIALMTANQIGDLSALLPGMKYGLGFGLDFGPRDEDGDRPLIRYYWGGLYSTTFWVDPGHEVVAVLMTQLLPTNASGAEITFRRLVDEAILD